MDFPAPEVPAIAMTNVDMLQLFYMNSNNTSYGYGLIILSRLHSATIYSVPRLEYASDTFQHIEGRGIVGSDRLSKAEIVCDLVRGHCE